MVIGIQPRNRLGDWRSKDNEMPAFVQQGSTKERREESQKGKKGSDSRGKKNCQMGNRR